MDRERQNNRIQKVLEGANIKLGSVVALQGQYHRGQINSLLRADGFEPVNIDFILL